MLAVIGDKLDSVKVLLEFGANQTLKDSVIFFFELLFIFLF